MKCQFKHCKQPAVIHITEIIDGQPRELHLCDHHARLHISAPPGAPPLEEEEVVEEEVAGAMAPLPEASNVELSRLDKRACPVCGITFREFRQTGRLGCAHDYEAFKKELTSLIENIHGAIQHCGKVPSGAPETIVRTSELLRLRQELKQAIEKEDYERAAELRDRIRELEGEL